LECLAVSGGGKIQYHLDVAPEQSVSGCGDAVAKEVEFDDSLLPGRMERRVRRLLSSRLGSWNQFLA
jgi:hypothetical protein